MKAFDKIFEIKDGLLQINKEEVRHIKEFKAILTRDRGGKITGDHDGRRKFVAFRELMYVHLFTSHLSIYRDLGDEQRHIVCKRDAALPDDWEVDVEIREACDKYRELENYSAVFHAFLNTSKAVYSIGEDVKFFNSQKEKARENIINKSKILEVTTLDEEKQELEKSIAYSTNLLMDLNNKIMTINNSLPNAFATLEDLHKKLIEESQDSDRVYGGGKLNSREK